MANRKPVTRIAHEGHVYSLYGHLNPQQGNQLQLLLPKSPSAKGDRLPYQKPHQVLFLCLEAEVEALLRQLQAEKSTL